MFRIEYRLVNYDSDLLPKQKGEVLHENAYLLLNEMLDILGFKDINILKTADGKPYIENNPVYFSISHTDGLVACCIADSPCGIDCEKIVKHDRVKELANRFFVENEIELIRNSGYSSEEFLKIWTCKEAIAKRLGCGLIKSRSIDSTKENCSTMIENGYIITINIWKSIDFDKKMLYNIREKIDI